MDDIIGDNSLPSDQFGDTQPIDLTLFDTAWIQGRLSSLPLVNCSMAGCPHLARTAAKICALVYCISGQCLAVATHVAYLVAWNYQ